MMTTPADYDIVIIGAGPAGSTAARLLAPKFRLLLIDGELPERAKPCGGLLAPDAQKALACFDLTLPKSVLVGPQIFAVRTIDLAASKQSYYQRSYINLDRYLFDRWLVSLIPERVEQLPGRCRAVRRVEEGRADSLLQVDVDSRSQGRVSLTCRMIIGADGADSLVRRSFFPQCKPQAYTAIQQWFKASEQQQNPFYSCIFDPATSESCSWSIFKDEYFIFGGAFAPANCRAMFEQQKQRLEPFGFNFGQPVKTEACLALRPRRAADFCLGNNNIYLAGEAAGLISPSSLEGISSAILSGTALAQAINQDEAGAPRRYAAATSRLRAKLLTKTVKRWFMYTPLPRRMIMTSGVQGIKMHQ